MKVSKKGILQQFGLVIYPVDFVVAIGDMEKEINDFYQPYEEEFKDARIAATSTTGTTYRVKEKETGIPCVLIWIHNVDEFTTSIVTHECAHAALEIWSYIGSEVSLTNQEPFCYLLGNLARLAVGCYYDIPGIKPPVNKKEAFERNIRKKK